MGTKWDEMKRSMGRSFKRNWNLFKQSKLGLVGLGIITFFVILAVFAPFLTPYTPDYLAPAGDLYVIDNCTYSLPQNMKNLNWETPIPLLTAPRQGQRPFLTGMFFYSHEGKGLLYLRDKSPQYQTVLRLVNHPWPVDTPLNIKTMKYIQYNHRIVGYANRDVHLFLVSYESNLIDINPEKFFKYDSIITFPFDIKYSSNIEDYNMSFSGGVSMISFAVASEHNVSLWMWSRGMNSMTFQKQTIVSQINLTVSDKIDGDPILIISPTYPDYHYLILPTENYIYGYSVQLSHENYSPVIALKNLTLVWKYPLNGHKLMSPSSISVVDPDAMDGNPKTYDIVVGLCEDNYGFGIYTRNGTLLWNETLYLNQKDARLHTVTFEGLHPTSQGLIAYGKTNVGDFIAMLNDHEGVVANNKTAYYILRGTINYISKYDIGAAAYYVSTDEGNIYEIKSSFHTVFPGDKYTVIDPNTGKTKIETASNTFGIGLDKSFTVMGGAATPAIFLGNIYGFGQTGTYIGLITKNGQIYLQASGGTRISTIVVPPFSYGRVSHNFYLFGTDYEGHDIWTWLVYGSRTSLIVGLTAAVISVIAGTFIGIISGFYGGWIDIVIMRTVDIILTLPGIVIMLLLAAILGPSIWNIVLIISVLGWAGIARVIRAMTLSLKNRPFMDAARVAGASNARLMTYHIFPNVVPLTFLYMTFGVAGAILSEAALAFLGLGDPNAVSWGMMLQYLRMYGQVTNPYAWGWLLMPGIFITLISLAFYLVGRAFDEIVNPRLRKR